VTHQAPPLIFIKPYQTQTRRNAGSSRAARFNLHFTQSLGIGAQKPPIYLCSHIDWTNDDMTVSGCHKLIFFCSCASSSLNSARRFWNIFPGFCQFLVQFALYHSIHFDHFLTSTVSSWKSWKPRYFSNLDRTIFRNWSQVRWDVSWMSTTL
jgi:hypothetical protein